MKLGIRTMVIQEGIGIGWNEVQELLEYYGISWKYSTPQLGYWSYRWIWLSLLSDFTLQLCNSLYFNYTFISKIENIILLFNLTT
jgi:hypothetical protein